MSFRLKDNVLELIKIVLYVSKLRIFFCLHQGLYTLSQTDVPEQKQTLQYTRSSFLSLNQELRAASISSKTEGSFSVVFAAFKLILACDAEIRPKAHAA